MPKVLFTPLAFEDLLNIWEYLATEADEDIADAFVDRIHEKCRSVARSPLGFRLRPELLEHLRSCPFKNYILFYVPIDDGIEVYRVLHAARDIEEQFNGSVMGSADEPFDG